MKSSSTDKQPGGNSWASRHIQPGISKAKELIGQDIWELENLGHKSLKARVYAMLRVLTLTFQGTKRNRIPVQAAALTYYSLIGLGPLIAIMIMVSSFIIDQGEDDNMALQAISKVIAYAAPTAAIETDETGAVINDGSEPQLTEEMTEMLNGIIETAQSGTVGVVGSLMLLFIGIQVLSSIEGSLNHLWGVKQGRKFGERIVFYWTIISLGSVLGAASLTLITFSTIERFVGQLPFGGGFLPIFLMLAPFLVFVMVNCVLAVFFRLIPNTRVEWLPAFTGAFFVTVAMHIYNKLSFLYVQQVVRNESLYGSVGIIVVLMIGLFMFWLLILIGAQVTYAVQNADYLTNENAWENVSERTREMVSLAVLMMASEKFARCEQAVHASELLETLRVPSHILNSSINSLIAIGMLNAVERSDPAHEHDRAYQPSRPLDKLTLGQFKSELECLGNNEGASLVEKSHPAVTAYLAEVLDYENNKTGSRRVLDFIQSDSSR